MGQLIDVHRSALYHYLSFVFVCVDTVVPKVVVPWLYLSFVTGRKRPYNDEFMRFVNVFGSDGMAKWRLGFANYLVAGKRVTQTVNFKDRQWA